LFKNDTYATASTGEANIPPADGVTYDSMFHNGESISDFRANLSGVDDWGQNLKAYKKLQWGSATNKSYNLGELYNFDSSISWGSNGWTHNDGFSQDYSKTFFKGSSYQVKVNVPHQMAANQMAYHVEARVLVTNTNSIFMVGSGQGNYMSTLTFKTPQNSVYSGVANYLKIKFY